MDMKTLQRPSGLMVNLRRFPWGIDGDHVSFFWIMAGERESDWQSHYQIIISSKKQLSETETGDVWDSGKAAGQSSVSVSYTGRVLPENTGFFWRVRIWDQDGHVSPYSDIQFFATGLKNWRYGAVWTGKSSNEPNVIFARKSFYLEKKELEYAIVHVTAALSGGSKGGNATRQFVYKLYTNGTFTGLGPHFSGYDGDYFYNTYDVTELIHEGRNVFGAICYARQDHRFQMQFKAVYKDGSSTEGGTDGSWRVMDGGTVYEEGAASIGTHYYQAMAENMDARRFPYGWDMADFLDDEWNEPLIKPVIKHLKPSPVDPVRRYMVSPSVIENRGEGHYFIDFGREFTGGIRLELSGVPNGCRLELRYGEELLSTFPVSVKFQMRTGNTYQEYFTLKAGNQVLENFGMKNFRYLEIFNVPLNLEKNQISGVALHQELSDRDSEFVSDDDLLNEVYSLCKYSIKFTAQDMMVDSQSRERGPYEGDLYVNQMSMYSFYRNYNLSRFTNEYLAYEPEWCEEYHQMTILSTWEDYMYTGDKLSLERLYPVLKGKILDVDSNFDKDKKLFRHCADEPGMYNSILVDWPPSQRDGFVFADYNTVLNAFHYAAAETMVNICDVLNQDTDRKYYRALADDIKLGLKKLYLHEIGRFADGMYEDGTLTANCSQHASFFPLAFGCVEEEEQREKISKTLVTDGMRCSIYAAQFFLSALYQAGKGREALSFLTSREYGRSWYHVIHNLKATIVPECWDTEQKPNMTFSHAWGSAPGNLIARYLCGILPAESGFKSMIIRPQIGDLRYLRARIPTIRGSVCIEIDLSKRVMKVEIPGNTSAKVYLPGHEQQKEVYCEVGPGAHCIVLE